MMRRLSMAALALLVAAPLAAQAPAGWQMRVDRSTNPADPDDVPDVKFVTMGNGYHVTTGPAVILWNPSNTASGQYTLKGTFTLTKPSGHRNSYGLFFGGASLDGPQQNYLYFLVDQEGNIMVKHRAGDATTHDVLPLRVHEAVKKPDESGRSTNALEVRVGADKIDFVVNGQVVHSQPKQGMASRTDGIWGVRVNHLLDVHIADLGVTTGGSSGDSPDRTP
ncbi:MAG TPA: hypothetical protein VF178_01995 [Gemmatimonadaceae bacterium]